MNEQKTLLIRMMRQSLESWSASGVTDIPLLPLVIASPAPSPTHSPQQAPTMPRPTPRNPNSNPDNRNIQNRSDPRNLDSRGKDSQGSSSERSADHVVRPRCGENELPQASLSRVLPPDSTLAAMDRTEALAVIDAQVRRCSRCAELARTRTQTVFGTGNTTPRLAFMGEAPGADEDIQGVPFVGRAGRLLTDMIEKGMKISRNDVYILNTLKCRPPGNRTPLPAEAACCREYLNAQLAVLRPEFICCLGAVAAQSLLNVSTPISKLRGVWHNLGPIRVLCTYHPAYLLRNPSAKRLVWEDLQILMREMGF